MTTVTWKPDRGWQNGLDLANLATGLQMPPELPWLLPPSLQAGSLASLGKKKSPGLGLGLSPDFCLWLSLGHPQNWTQRSE